MKSFEPLAYALLRIFAGFLFLWHGTQKLFGWPEPQHVAEGLYMKWLGGGIEFLGGLLICFGLFTRPAAFLCSGTMAVAYWQFHGTNLDALLPIQNGGEMAVLYCFVFLFLFARGGGKLSLDGAQQQKKAKQKAS